MVSTWLSCGCQVVGQLLCLTILTGNVINLREICLFFVGADAYIGPKGSIFNPLGMMEMAFTWPFPLHETLTPIGLRADVGIGPLR